MSRWIRIVVTGATSGVGAAFARAAPADAALLLTGRDTAKLTEIRDALIGSRTVETLTADLSEDDDRRRLIDAALHFTPDLLINNAGFGCFGPAMDNPRGADAGMIETNAHAPVALTRALAPGMIERARASGGRAGLIFVSSVVAFAPFPLYATYAATKAFVNSYAQALAEELRNAPADVLALCPGATKTAFHDRAGAAFTGPMDSAERVAREGYAALGKRTIHVVNPRNKMVVELLRAIPRGVLMRGLSAAMRARGAGAGR